jgi:hypothetical protein
MHGSPRTRCAARSSGVALLCVVAACGGSSSPPDSASPDAPTTVTVTLDHHPVDATSLAFVTAYQDGDGPWQLAPAPEGDTYTLPVSSATYAFAWTCARGAEASVNLGYFSVAERAAHREDVVCNAPTLEDITLAGTVSNPPAPGTFTYSAAYGAQSAAVVTNNNLETFSLAAPSGPHDLFVHGLPTGMRDPSTRRVAVARAVIAPTSSAMIDWGTSELVQSASVTFPPVTPPMDFAATTTDLFSAGGTRVRLATGSTPMQMPPFRTVGLAAAQRAAGDLYVQQAQYDASAETSRFVVEQWTSTIGDLTITAMPQLTGVSGPPAAVTWDPYPGATGYRWSTQARTGVGDGIVLTWTAHLGPGYAGVTPRFSLPDLTALPGWSSVLDLPGSPRSGEVAAFTSTTGAADFPFRSPATDGTRRTTVVSLWTAP